MPAEKASQQASTQNESLDETRLFVPRTAHQLYLHDHLQRMHNEIESTTRKLELEKRRLDKLEKDVSRMRNEYEEKIHKGGNKKDNPTKVTSVRTLEHRLARAISTLDVLGHDNKDVREKIDAIRKDRLHMNQVFKKLEQEIKENIGSVTQLQRESHNQMREQDERQTKMNAMRKMLELERKKFKSSVKDMQERLKDEGFKELRERVVATRESLEHAEDDKGRRMRCLRADEEENFNTQGIMKRILKLAFLNAIQRRHIRQQEKNIEVFEQAFATIKSTTGISDIEEIVNIFIGLEQRNFSLLTYVNTLNREIEQFEKLNRDLEGQITGQKRSVEMNAKTRTEKLSEIQQQILNTERAIEENLLQAQQQQEVSERCRPLVSGILKLIEKENRGFGGQPAPELSGENVLAWMTYVEKTLTQWKDFLPEAKTPRHHKAPIKNYKYTVGNQVLMLQPKKHNVPPAPLVKPAELPSAANVFLEGTQPRGATFAGRAEEDTDTDEEELQNHPWTRQELRDKAIASVAKRKKHRKLDASGVGQVGNAQVVDDRKRSETDDFALGDQDKGGAELSYDDIVEQRHRIDHDDESFGSDDSDGDDEAGPTDEEINEVFLKRYKMSKEELQTMADKMGIQLNNLCYLKQEFDAYDEDRSGFIDARELKGLLEKLGEALTDEELDQAFRELDSDGSGEIEFFEFVEWFTSED